MGEASFDNLAAPSLVFFLPKHLVSNFMTASTFELQFATSHIRVSFGEVPYLVFQFICRHGSPSLQDIVEDIGCSTSKCRKAVFILLKHFCISSALHKRFSKRSSTSCRLYIPELQNVYHRLSFPGYVKSLFPHTDRCGKSMHDQLVKLLLQHGSVSEDKMMQIFSENSVRAVSYDDIRKCIDDLKRDSFFVKFKGLPSEEFPFQIPKENGGSKGVNDKTNGQSDLQTQNFSSQEPLTMNFECCNKYYLNKIRENFITSYSIAVPSTEISKEELTAKIIELMVENRFGSSAGRIFRLLFLSRHLEQKQIADIAMLPLKDTREILYKLLQCGYLYLQEVSKSSDHAPSRTIYLWKVDLVRVKEEIIADTNKKIFNIQSRLYLDFVSGNNEPAYSFVHEKERHPHISKGPGSKILDVIVLEFHELALLLNSCF